MAERKRLTGFGLMDAAFAADAKFVRLARLSPSPTDFAAAVGVFWLLLADCRRNKSPLVKWADYEEYQAQVGLLRSCQLLDGDGFREEPFAKWAPVYQSPFDGRRGTQGDTGLHKGTQHDTVYSEVGSSKSESPVDSFLPREGKNGEEPTQLDGYGFMCRLLGYAPNSQKFSHDVDELENEHGVERTVQAAQGAFTRSVEEGHRLSPFDLLRDTRTLLLTGKHRVEKELTAQEAAAQKADRKKRDAAWLADIDRQQEASLADAIAKAKAREPREGIEP